MNSENNSDTARSFWADINPKNSLIFAQAIPSLRGFFLFSAIIFFACLTTSLIVSGFGSPELYNSSKPGLWLIPLTLGGGAFLVVLSPTKKILFGAAFVAGGAISNTFDRFVFGPVADYLIAPIIISQNVVFNIADCFIVVGLALLTISVIHLIYEAFFLPE